MSTQLTTTRSTRITLVESEACHFCDQARGVLDELALTYPLLVDIVDVRSEQGRSLMQSYRASMSPLVLLEGQFFSNGRLPRRKLTRLLDERLNDTSAPVG